MTIDLTKPEANSLAASAEMRTNFLAIAEALAGIPLGADPTFLIRPAGDTSTLAHWQTDGTGVTHDIAGTGQTDTKRKVGAFCGKLIGGSTASKMYQRILTTSSYDDGFNEVNISLGCWVWCASGNDARMFIDDGDDRTDSTDHAGTSAWIWKKVSHPISDAATKIEYGLEVDAGVTAYMSAPTIMFGDTPPEGFRPPPVVYGSIVWPFIGDVSVTEGPNSDGTDMARHIFARPGLVREVQLHAVTAPAGSAIIVDVNHDGNSMFSTLPQIAAAANAGSAVPDGTYRYRCFTGRSGATITDAKISCDIDQKGSGTAGAYLTVFSRVMQFARPLELMLGASEIS